MQECISKEKLKCIFLTKDTRDEFLRESEPELFKENECVNIEMENDTEIIVTHLGTYTAHYYYNHWYVNDDPEYYWTDYTKKEFEEYFEIVR